MIFSPYKIAVIAISLLLVLPSKSQGSTCDVRDPFGEDVYSELDTGLYWYGSDPCEKAKASDSSNYYNRYAPTLIYIHGWQNGTTAKTERETFLRALDSSKDNDGYSGNTRDVAQYWRSQGWNVGILYWNQYADEGNVEHAEAKIWSDDGPRDMNYKFYNGSGADEVEVPNAGFTATDVLFDSYKDAMSNYAGSNVRFLGHSLGNQMALALAEKVSKEIDRGRMGSNTLPNRIALLDPFYSMGGKSYLNGRWPGERAKDAADLLRNKGVVMEAYRSSPVTSTIFVGDENRPLLDRTAFAELKPWEFSATDLGGKHSAAVVWYMWSYELNNDIPVTNNNSTNAPSARMNNSDISYLMSPSAKKHVHDQGAYTTNPHDDNMKEANR